MALTIKQRNEKWRIKIEEEFQFKDLETMKLILDYLLELKKDYGQLRKDI